MKLIVARCITLLAVGLAGAVAVNADARTLFRPYLDLPLDLGDAWTDAPSLVAVRPIDAGVDDARAPADPAAAWRLETGSPGMGLVIEIDRRTGELSLDFQPIAPHAGAWSVTFDPPHAMAADHPAIEPHAYAAAGRWFRPLRD